MTNDKPPVTYPTVKQANPADNPLLDPTVTPDHKASQDKGKGNGIGAKLGSNRKARGGPRALTKADAENLTRFYQYMSLGLAPFKQKAAIALAENAETCATSWCELAEQNDNVRKVILGLLEGGAWGGVILAHMPIVLAMLPEELTERVPFLTDTAENESDENE